MKHFTLILTFLLTGILISCNKENEVSLDLNSLVAVWELDKFIDKNNNSFLAPKIQISFRENNCITVFTSYNHGHGEFSVKGNKVTLYNLKLTTREYDLENDNRFTRNLTGSYLIKGDTLRILSDYDFDMVLYKTQIKDRYQGDLTTLLIDKFNSNRYYPYDIFDAEFSTIYGKWFLFSFYGGWGGGEEAPRFDFLEVKKNGIYGISKGFELLEYGRIDIEKIISDERLRLEFIPFSSNPLPLWTYKYQNIRISEKDSIFLHDSGCLDCYGHNFHRIN